ncbi:peptidase M14, partial [Candidatus Sumerlaeota bacterium]|nr:peptidase M14 [Candidatus Sumerlaeota bacterium]
QKYAGHDNNRDWFMLNLKETRLTTEVLYKEWYPTIVWDVHQMGNSGARLFVPPFHDPKNQNVHPIIDQTLLIVGGHMSSDLARQGMKGVVHGAIYDNWWAGGFRTTVYRHNMIGILTETASVNLASPVFQRKSQLRGGSRGFPSYQIATNFPEPWPGGWWRLRDIVDYELTAIMSLLTYAARYHEELQGNFLHMGRNAIEQGLSEPPFAWLVPPDQRDPRTATWMLDLLQATGIDVHQAEDDFVADGVAYPAGTFIMYCSQPFRAHLMDMMERQIYPDREIYPGGPAEAPYDNAGWTLPLQMGVRRVAVALPFVARARLLDAIPIPEGNLEGRDNARQYVIAAQYNDDYRLINRLNKAGIPIGIYRGGEDWDLADGRSLPPGSILIRDGRSLRDAMPDVLQGVSSSPIGISGLDEEIESAIVDAPPPRIGLYQPWTASMDEGWTRYVLDTFEYNYTTVHNADILAGNLHDRYDCLILPSVGAQSILRGRAPDTTAPEYVGGIGPEGVISLQDFVQDGGTLICVDQSSNLPIGQFNIPVSNIVRGKSSEEFYCPGSVLRVRLDPSHPVAYGMPEWISAYFTRSMAFEVERSEGRSGSRQGRRGSPRENEEDEETGQRGGAAGAPGDPSRSAAARFPTEVVGRYSDTVLLESGWIRGEELIRDQPAVVEVQYGEGRIVMFAFRVLHRAQPHGTFRLLFNAIQLSTLGEAEE